MLYIFLGKHGKSHEKPNPKKKERPPSAAHVFPFSPPRRPWQQPVRRPSKIHRTSRKNPWRWWCFSWSAKTKKSGHKWLRWQFFWQNSKKNILSYNKKRTCLVSRRTLFSFNKTFLAGHWSFCCLHLWEILLFLVLPNQMSVTKLSLDVFCDVSSFIERKNWWKKNYFANPLKQLSSKNRAFGPFSVGVFPFAETEGAPARPKQKWCLQPQLPYVP